MSGENIKLETREIDKAKNPERCVEAIFNFTPSWWYKNYWLKFDRDYYSEPQVRVDTIFKTRRLLWERFGDIGLGAENPSYEPFITTEVDFIASLFGAESRFAPDMYPWAESLNYNDETVEKLEPPRIDSHPVLIRYAKQMEYLQQRYGRVDGGINYQGILNISSKIMGSRIFGDLYEKPEIVRHLFEVVCQTIISVFKWEEKYHKMEFCIQNCTVTMISPQLYEKLLLDYDMRICQELPVSSIHHCGKFEPYLSLYKKIDKVSHLKQLSIGSPSVISMVRAAFPQTHLAPLFPVILLKNGSQEEVAEKVKQILKDGAPFDRLSVDCADIEYGTPDDNIKTVVHTLWKHGEY